jgi:hypothetical protein
MGFGISSFVMPTIFTIFCAGKPQVFVVKLLDYKEEGRRPSVLGDGLYISTKNGAARMAVLTARDPTASSWGEVSVALAVAAVDGGTSLDASLCVWPSRPPT